MEAKAWDTIAVSRKSERCSRAAPTGGTDLLAGFRGVECATELQYLHPDG